MGRQTARATTWTCDVNPRHTDVRTDSEQDVPPRGWRVLHVLPENLNLALEGEPHMVLLLCTGCYSEFRGLFVMPTED